MAERTLTWPQAVAAVLAELDRYAAYRDLGYAPYEIAPRMQISVQRAEGYARALTELRKPKTSAAPGRQGPKAADNSE
jgi:hypothetical protein